MNEKIIEEFLKYMNETKDFLLQEAPDVIIQMMSYYKISAWISLIGVFVSLIFSLSVFSYSFLYPNYESYGSLTVNHVVCRMISAFVILICIISIIPIVDSLIHIYTAPKHFIISKLLLSK